MHCPSCGFDNPEGMKFCGECATTLGDIRLQVMANYRLGQGYFLLGNYRRAINCLRDNVAALEGDLRYARFGTEAALADGEKR